LTTRCLIKALQKKETLVKDYYKGSAWKMLSWRRTQSLLNYLQNSVWFRQPRQVRRQAKTTLALAKNDALFQRCSTVNVKTLPYFVKRVLKLNQPLSEQVHSDSLTLANAARYQFRSRTTGRRRVGGRRQRLGNQHAKPQARLSFLRKAIMAPEGYQLVVGDLSQIEPRVLAWLSDYQDMLDIFRAGGDPYAAFGAQMFNIPELTKDSHPDLRQSAKARYLVAAMASVGRRLHPNFVLVSLVRRRSGTRKDFAKR
jgi:hypothetical protein